MAKSKPQPGTPAFLAEQAIAAVRGCNAKGARKALAELRALRGENPEFWEVNYAVSSALAQLEIAERKFRAAREALLVTLL